MQHELTKSEKKIARQIIERGLMKEYLTGIRKMEDIISDWKANQRSHREAYMDLYETLINFDKRIARRYDRMSGAKYIFVIAGQLADRVISVNDLEGLREETILVIKLLAGED